MWINVICWGILIDIPIIFVRYFKTKKWYINAHWIAIVILMTGSVFAEFAMIYTDSNNFKYETFKENNSLS